MEVTGKPAVVVVAVPAVVSASSSPNPRRREGGSCTGVRKTMTQTTTTRKAPASPNSLRLCSSAPMRAVRKKPLSKQEEDYAHGAFHPTSVPKRAPRRQPRAGPTTATARPPEYRPPDEPLAPGPSRWTLRVDPPGRRVVKSSQQAWCLRSQAPGRTGAEREAGEIPARSRHCDRGPAPADGEAACRLPPCRKLEPVDFGSQIPAAEEEQTLSVERAHSALMSRGANSVRPGHGPAGE